MQPEMKRRIRRVLRDAANSATFFDLSQVEQMNWLLIRMYEICCKGRRSLRSKGRARRQGCGMSEKKR
jgi:hypothetical protein